MKMDLLQNILVLAAALPSREAAMPRVRGERRTLFHGGGEDCNTTTYTTNLERIKMPGPSNTLLIEGSFSELSEELAQFIDGVAKAEEGAGLRADIKSNIEAIQQIEQAEDSQTTDQAKLGQLKDDTLKKIVTKAEELNNAPEKGKDKSS